MRPLFFYILHLTVITSPTSMASDPQLWEVQGISHSASMQHLRYSFNTSGALFIIFPVLALHAGGETDKVGSPKPSPSQRKPVMQDMRILFPFIPTP